MSIDNVLNSISGAPAVRNVSGNSAWDRLMFRSLEREEIFGGRASYKHLAPNGAKARTICCTSKLNSR
jgi:hypothetical protein